MSGLGIVFEVGQDSNVYIKELVRDGPAFTSGHLVVGDALLACDGVNVAHDSVESISQRIIGPVGSSVSLIFERSGFCFEVHFQRGVVNPKAFCRPVLRSEIPPSPPRASSATSSVPPEQPIAKSWESPAAVQHQSLRNLYQSSPLGSSQQIMQTPPRHVAASPHQSMRNIYQSAPAHSLQNLRQRSQDSPAQLRIVHAITSSRAVITDTLDSAQRQIQADQASNSQGMASLRSEVETMVRLVHECAQLSQQLGSSSAQPPQPRQVYGTSPMDSYG